MQLLSEERQREMNNIASLKLHQSTEDERFYDCYPIDKLLEI